MHHVRQEDVDFARTGPSCGGGGGGGETEVQHTVTSSWVAWFLQNEVVGIGRDEGFFDILLGVGTFWRWKHEDIDVLSEQILHQHLSTEIVKENSRLVFDCCRITYMQNSRILHMRNLVGRVPLQLFELPSDGSV